MNNYNLVWYREAIIYYHLLHFSFTKIYIDTIILSLSYLYYDTYS